MWTRPTFRCLILALLLAGPAGAEDSGAVTAQTLAETLRVNKQALIEVNLGLGEAEAEAFWPLYERYQAELGAVQTRLLEVIEAYRASFGNTSDEQAQQLARDYLAVEYDRAAVRRKYLDEISAVLPGRKVMRFYQIENKIDAVLRYELAASIPVVQQ